MGHHEKCAPQEIFLGNIRPSSDHHKWLASRGLNTLRTGKTAYAIDGKPLGGREGYVPLFIHRNEADRYNAIMMERTFGPNWRRN